jgi:ABC-type phosphate/phosphonate transport system substrate-binding protein
METNSVNLVFCRYFLQDKFQAHLCQQVLNVKMKNNLYLNVAVFIFYFTLWSSFVHSQAVFRVGLWADEADLSRAGDLQSALVQILNEEPGLSGFDQVAVESTMDPQQRVSHLIEGRYLLVECEPALYFLTRRSRTAVEPERWQYDVIFQGLERGRPPGKNRGVIAVRQDAEFFNISDLRGTVLGVVHPDLLTSGLVQLEYLEQFGLEEGRNLRVVHAESAEALAAALFADLVDAAAIPEDLMEEFIQAKEGALTGQNGAVRYLFRSDPLPGPLWAIHRRLVRTRTDLVARLRNRLPYVWAREELVPSVDDYYLTTQRWLRGRP